MPTDQRPLAIFLMGPTASGKTAFALELAASGRFGLISVDSALVYRGLDIGSAKPDAATLAQFPHALIDIREPEQAYSAAEFCADARVAMDAIAAAGKIPLLVGGTGLYFRALGRGLRGRLGQDGEWIGTRAQPALILRRLIRACTKRRQTRQAGNERPERGRKVGKRRRSRRSGIVVLQRRR